MKNKSYFLLLVAFMIFMNLPVVGQTGSYVYTVAGGGTAPRWTSGPATSASISRARGVYVDISGNVYFAEGDSTIQKVAAATGIITTIAGPGSTTSDGVPATSAILSGLSGVTVDAADNIYLTTYGLVRKINAATGNISTIAGNGTSASDGIPATAASLNSPSNVFLDHSGDLLILERYRLRKITSSTGIITTIAGGGTSGLGDGGAATNAQIISSSVGIAEDAAGNIYFADGGSDRIRKVDAITGIITTIAGGGTSTADGVPATSARLNNLTDIAVDCYGNIYAGSLSDRKIKVIYANTGTINTIAGGGGSASEGDLPLNTDIRPEYMFLDNYGNLFYSNNANKVRRITNLNPRAGKAPTISSDSIDVYVIKNCNGPKLIVSLQHYDPAYNIITDYGDGKIDTTPVAVNILSGASAMIYHSYPVSGTYNIKVVMVNASVRLDSVSFAYTYSFCRTVPVLCYIEKNSNCIKDPGETYMRLPSSIEVSKNGIANDTISVLCGTYYDAYCNPGDLFTFKPITFPGNTHVSCPPTGSISQTILASTTTYAAEYFGFTCGASSGFDLREFTTVRVGPHRLSIALLIDNALCIPTPATLTVNISPKFQYWYSNITPATTTGNTTTWNFGSLDVTDPTTYLSISAKSPTGVDYFPGDTVKSEYYINPISGDGNPVDNIVISVDTVKSSYDPNFVDVSPAGCIVAGTELQYTIGFENTGNDTAHNIYVMDTLSNFIDPSSFRMVSASADVFVHKSQHLGQTVLKFDFPNIMLPDSSHKDLCHGLFIYKVKTKVAIPYWSLISNRAGIYFDENPVVMTNTATNTVGCPPVKNINTYVNQNNVTLYPNPTTDELTIKTANSSYTSLTISNSIGQVLLQQAISNTQTKVNVKVLPAGLYYVTIRGENGNSVQKFVKL